MPTSMSSTAHTVWPKALVPLAVLLGLCGVAAVLAVVLMKPWLATPMTVGAVVLMMWPVFFVVASVALFGASVALRDRPATLLDAPLSNGNAMSFALSIVAAAGSVIGIATSVVAASAQQLASSPSFSSLKDIPQLGAFALAVGVGALLGALGLPSLLNVLLVRLQLSRGLVRIADGLLFAIGVALSVVLLRDELLPHNVAALMMLIGAVALSPIGFAISHRLLFGSRGV
jgi:hypothetical protein